MHGVRASQVCMDRPVRPACLQDECVPGCPENTVGITFYRYILTNVVSMCGVNIFTAISYKLVGWLKTYDAPSVSSAASQHRPYLFATWQLKTSLMSSQVASSEGCSGLPGQDAPGAARSNLLLGRSCLSTSGSGLTLLSLPGSLPGTVQGSCKRAEGCTSIESSAASECCTLCSTWCPFLPPAPPGSHGIACCCQQSQPAIDPHPSLLCC